MEIRTASSPSMVHAELLWGQTLPFAPEWQFRTLSVGPRRSSAAYNTHVANTVGSSYDFGDEMRFGNKDGALRGFVLTMPDKNAEHADSMLDAWLSTPRQQALLRLSTPAPFALDGADVRAIDKHGRALLSAFNVGTQPDTRRLRISVATDTDFLFADGRFCGWLLVNPMRHLRHERASDEGARSSASTGGEALALLHSYLALVADPNIELMEDQSASMKTALINLKHRAIQASACAPEAREIAAQIDELLDRFY
ncbi:hypothetical protein WMF31_34485 [Sorangium sp. So ce1036]|uniref:hypothetical protein n=1 Tax=Sorangium TaxID=39643 RepID=UPI0010101DEA|nr:hypothetical protein [Sorangium cellulosum]